MVFWVKHVLTIAAMGAFLTSCSEDLQKAPDIESSTSGDISEITPATTDSFFRSAPVVFTEINPKNSTFEDEDGDHSDWIELFNPADTSVNLSGYTLSNSPNKIHQWKFGNVTISPKSFLIVFFSKKDRPDLEEPSDSTDLLGFDSWSWSDAQNSPVQGASVVKPWLTSGYISTENGNRFVSAEMQLASNEELGWSSACVFVGVHSTSTSDTHDLGSANQIGRAHV